MNQRNGIHWIGVTLGALILGIGLVVLIVPNLATALPIGFLVAEVAAGSAMLMGLWVVRKAYAAPKTQTAVPNVEFPLSVPTPGDDIDDLVYRLTELREGTLEYREQIQERVTEIAITVNRQRQDCSREQAIRQLEEGTWTDDPMAAAFFASGEVGTSSPSLLDELRNRFTGGESAYKQQLRAVVDAIEDVGEFDYPHRSDGSENTEEGGRGVPAEALLSDEEGERVTETVRYRSSLSTHHWAGITAFAFIALSAGVLTAQPSLILASAIGVGLGGYAAVGSPPPLANLGVTRNVNNLEPEPGEEVRVTVRVENNGEAFLPDLRLIDRVPPTMTVVDGSARLGTALRPGGSATFRYTLKAERGQYSWPLQAIGRDASGSHEREALIDSETTVECVPRLKTVAEMPVRLQTSVYAGDVNTKIGGEGLEFHSVRDYQPGDSKRRIDWKKFARTGEFSTIDFRKEKAARVVLLFDSRESAYVSSEPGKKHAADQSVEVAFDIFASLYDQGHLIGIAAFNGIPCWLGPSIGTLHLQRVRNLFVDHPALSSLPPKVAEAEAGRYVDPMIHVRRQLPENTQIFLFSPLTDEYTYGVARRLNGAGHLVTVISPDPTADRSVGQRLARLERSVLIKRLRDHGIRVIDWGAERPIDIELEYANRRWNA